MKKIVVSASIVFVLLFSSVVYASDFIKVSIFQVSILINGIMDNNRWKDDYTIFTYNDYTYVPIRYIAEKMGGRIRYEPEKKSISIDAPLQTVTASTVNNRMEHNDFILSIHSAKSVYKQGEQLQIWGDLQYMGSSERTIFHGNPPMYFTITDQTGEESGPLIDAIGIKTILHKFDELHAPFTFSTVEEYHYFKHFFKDENNSSDNLPAPWMLERGEYKVKMVASFRDEGDKNNTIMESALNITIQ